MKKMKIGMAGLLAACALAISVPALAQAPAAAPGTNAQTNAEAQGREVRCGVRSDGVVYCEIVIVW